MKEQPGNRDTDQGLLGVATLMDTASSLGPRLNTDGLCLSETIEALEDGGRGMPATATAQIRAQAIDVVDAIVKAYHDQIAVGEVGADGSAQAASGPPSSERCPTGLLYGRVQSGKTAAMILTTALAIDNGFRVFIVLTSNNVKLVKQTYRRFNILQGPLVYSSIQNSGNYMWARSRENIKRHIGTRGVVFVCAKDSTHLRNLVEFLRGINASDYPALILDDEADQATPDTYTAKRSRGNHRAPASTTYRRVISNDAPGEEGESIREALRHHVFLQVTATPYGLLLQNVDSQIRPAFTRLLSPGEGYTGGEAFFSRYDSERDGPPDPPLVFVSDLEAGLLKSKTGEIPTGLAKAIAFFLLSASAHRLQHGAPAGGYKFLCHTSMVRIDHSELEKLIRRYIDSLADELDRDLSVAISTTVERLANVLA